MAYSKAPLFDQVVFKQSFWFKALSHPARIIILTYLLENGVTAFNVIAKNLPLAKTTVSQHLRQLRLSGIVDSFEKYPHSYYKINSKMHGELMHQLKALHFSFIIKDSRHEPSNHLPGIPG